MPLTFKTPMAAAWLLAMTVTGIAPVNAEDRSTEPNRPVLIEPDGGDRVWVFANSPQELGPGGEFHIYVDSKTHPDAKGSFAKFSLGPEGQLPVHRHDKTEEISYFLSGEGVVVQATETGEMVEVPVTAGHVWYVPPGAWHAIKNTAGEPLTLVFSTIPNEKNGLLSFFRRIGAQPGQEPTPVSPEEFARLAAEHDLNLRPPPSSD